MSSITLGKCIKYSNRVCFSQNGELIAYAKGPSLFVYNISSSKLLCKYTFIDIIDSIEWSNDSTQLLIGIYSRNICEVKSLTDPSLNCKIDEGKFGMNNARFVPNNKSIITLNHFNMRMNIWSIEDSSSPKFINNPKYSHKGLDFSPNGVLLALAKSKEGEDHLGIYNTNDWIIINSFKVITYDLQDIKWTLDNTNNIIVWDSYIECRFIMYSAFDGTIISIVEPYKLDLGIKALSISPNGQFIAIGCFDQTVKTYKCLNECEMIESFEHGELQIEDKVVYLQEVIIYADNDDYHNNKTVMFKKLSAPLKLEVNEISKQLTPSALPVKGVQFIEWSHDSNYLASKNENMPNIIWIWKMATLALHCVIVFSTSINTFKWSPNDLNLLITCNTPYIYIYDINHITVQSLPSTILSIDTIIWNENEHDRNSVLLCNQSDFIVCELKNPMSKSVSTFIKDF